MWKKLIHQELKQRLYFSFSTHLKNNLFCLGFLNYYASLIKYNTVKHKRQNTSATCHSRKNEPPLPVKIELMVHAKARKESLVEKLAIEG